MITITTRIIFLLVLTMQLTPVYSQTKYTGYEYDLNSDKHVAFKFTKEYKTVGIDFTTIYKIYHPTKGNHVYTITATHYKESKKVKVELEAAGGGVFAHINSEETEYKTPSLDPFGFR